LKVSELQRKLESIYRLEEQPSVEEFLLKQEAGVRSQLILQKDSDGYSIGIQIGIEILNNIESQGLSAVSLQDFCTAAEEISHFTYLYWTISNHRPVSLLDIELQGEIDKFVLASIYFSNDTLFSKLFEGYSMEEGLSAEERLRYEEAHRLGKKFCFALLKGFQELKDLRCFYRLNSSERLSLVERMK